MHIRLAAEADYDYILSNDRHVLPSLILPKIKQQEIYVFLNEDDVKIGWLRYGYFWDHLPFMNLLWIDEPYRGLGLGRQAVLHWEQAMQAMGHKQVMTSTMSNEAAQHFYRKLGYKDSGSLLMDDEPLEILFIKAL